MPLKLLGMNRVKQDKSLEQEVKTRTICSKIIHCCSFSFAFPAASLVFNILGEVFAYVTVL